MVNHIISRIVIFLTNVLIKSAPTETVGGVFKTIQLNYESIKYVTCISESLVAELNFEATISNAPILWSQVISYSSRTQRSFKIKK